MVFHMHQQICHPMNPMQSTCRARNTKKQEASNEVFVVFAFFGGTSTVILANLQLAVAYSEFLKSHEVPNSKRSLNMIQTFPKCNTVSYVSSVLCQQYLSPGPEPSGMTTLRQD